MTELSVYFESPYTAVIAVTGAVLWTLLDTSPLRRFKVWQRALGTLLVAFGGLASLLFDKPLAEALLESVSGLGASWLLVEVIGGFANVATRSRDDKNSKAAASTVGIVFTLILSIMVGSCSSSAAVSGKVAQAVLKDFSVQVQAGDARVHFDAELIYVSASPHGVLRAQTPYGAWEFCWFASGQPRPVCAEHSDHRVGAGPWAWRVEWGVNNQFIRLVPVDPAEVRPDGIELIPASIRGRLVRPPFSDWIRILPPPPPPTQEDGS
ncbi:MAG: hypothetical protein ACPGO7_01115 [Alphaproteobacteria bacterium]